jgi:hypothetical protein
MRENMIANEKSKGPADAPIRRAVFRDLGISFVNRQTWRVEVRASNGKQRPQHKSNRQKPASVLR